MAFAKDHPCSFHGSYMFEEASSSPIQFPSDPYAALYSLQEDDSDDHIISVNQKVHVSQSPPLSSSCSETSSNGFALHGGGSSYPQPEEANKTTTTSYVDGFMHTNGSFLSFKNQNCYDHYPLWEGSMMYGEGPPVAAALEQTSFSKNRPLMREENMQTLKKQCTRKQTNKPKPSKSAKDPQSIAAKNRRERISERLKILQDIVPNGSKVDLVTMLEKAISYVKFLQLQVKVLATDEFWPAGGGMLPDITQVREAIDAILSTQRNINNCPTQSNEKVIEEIIDSE